MSVRIITGDCLTVLPQLAAEGVRAHAVVCDPPYHLTTGKKGGSGPASASLATPHGRARITTGFMGQGWDGGDVAFRPETWAAVMACMRPGAHLVAFGGTRTWHRMAVAIEDAGFEIRDTLSWNYASGFPKSHSVNKALGDSICSCDQPEILPEMRRNTLSASAVSYPKVLRSHLRGGGQARNNADVDLPDLQSALDAGYSQTGALQQDMLPEVCGTDDRCGTDAGDPSGSPAQEQDADDLLCLPDSVLSKRQACQAGGGADVFSAVQRGGADQDASFPCLQGTRQLDSGISGQRDCKDDWPKESGLEGRSDASASQGQLCERALRPLPVGPSEHGPQGRVCDAASAGDGAVGGPMPDTNGVRSSQGSRPAEQRTRQPRTLAGQSQSQDGGAWPVCQRCGKPCIPSGIGTALKPAFEPIILARVPLDGTVAGNTLRHGCGGLNIDACRIPAEGPRASGWSKSGSKASENIAMAGPNGAREPVPDNPAGRWPANVIHDGSAEVEAAFAVYGERATGAGGLTRKNNNSSVYSGPASSADRATVGYADTGTASRFFYSSKADATDRAGSLHPTVKPTDLMRWLVQLTCPPGGLVLDPFAGTGSTGLAADQLGMDAILVERDPTYAADALRKISADGGLFSTAAAE